MRARGLGHVFLGAVSLSLVILAAGSARPVCAQAAPGEGGESGAAQEAGAGGVGEGGGWVVAAYLGGARTRPTSLGISQPALGTSLTFEGVRLEGRSFDPPLYYGFRGGYFFRRRPSVGAEAEFIHLKVFSDPAQRVAASGQLRGQPLNGEVPLGSVVRQYSISHGANLLLFNLAGRYRAGRGEAAPDGRLILTGRAGLGPTIPHTESNIEGQTQEQYELGRLAWQLAGGAEVRLWRGLYALGEYKFTRTRQRGAVAGGEARALLRTHHGVFGLSYHFR
jgi:opacity protein-like surface antigen